MHAAERGLIRGATRVRDAVRDWIRGGSEQDTLWDILNDQGPASSDITPEDRTKLREDEVAVALPDEKVDELIINQATFNLGLWVRPQQK